MVRAARNLAIIAVALGYLVATPSVTAQVLDIRIVDGRVVSRSQPAPDVERAAPPAGFVALRTAPLPVARAIHTSSIRHGVPVELVEAVAWQESRYRQSAISSKGARGVMQLTPATAETLGVDAADMEANIDGGVAYLAKLIDRFGDTRLALAAYNAGPRTVQRYGGIPPYKETRHYVETIMSRVETGAATRDDRA